ncbi:MAG: helix-turn-helix transcriptional regulator [Nocardiopsaceae bacterium]|nr:helix-turn-helix transcriptional regulator [Nocardiopsaceae bacterium]
MPAARDGAMATFAGQLRAWRAARSWSQAGLAGTIGYSDSLVSGIENAQKIPTADFAARCDGAFETPGTFAALQELVSREAWPTYFGPVLDFEKDAVRIHEWEMRVVPGMLQAKEYARAVISAGQPGLGDAELDRKVAGRLARQEILAQDKPPLYWAVIGEAALRQRVGGPGVMRGQLDKLIEVAQRQRVVIQVLPFAATDNPGSDGPLVIYDLAEGTSAAYCECKGGGMVVESPDAVGDLVTTMGMIRALSLPPRESADMLRRIRNDHD